MSGNAFTHEAIFCIVNSGYSEAVMDAAKKFGARGGTVLNARGTAGKEAEKFFGISVQAEKEIVMIVVPKANKDDILHALYKEVGAVIHYYLTLSPLYIQGKSAPTQKEPDESGSFLIYSSLSGIGASFCSSDTSCISSFSLFSSIISSITICWFSSNLYFGNSGSSSILENPNIL